MANSYTPASLLTMAMEQTLAETRLTERPMLGLLAASTQVQNQRPIEWPVRLSDAAVSGRALLDPIGSDDTAGALAKAATAIPDFYIRHKFTVIKRDLIEAAATGRIELVRNAVGAQLDDAMLAFTGALEKALFNGVGTLNNTHFGIYGLAEIIKQTGSYAGISRSTYPRWKSIVKAGATPGTPEALSVDRVTALLRDRRKAGASYAKNNGSRLIIVTNDEIEKDVLRKLYKDEVHLQSDYDRVVANIQPFSNYQVQGIPVVSAIECPNNTMYWLDLSKIGLYQFNDNGPAAMNDDKISFVQYEGLQIRLAEVNVGQHPDKVELELSASFQVKAHDPVQSVSVLQDVSHTI